MLFSVYHKNGSKSIFIRRQKSDLRKKKIFDNYKEMLYNDRVCFDFYTVKVIKKSTGGRKL